MNTYVTGEILKVLINAVNLWLKATGSPLRVSADGFTVTYRDGILFLALREANHD